MSAQIIQFAAARAADWSAVDAENSAPPRAKEAPANERKGRYREWRVAAARTDYWRKRLHYMRALERALHYKVAAPDAGTALTPADDATLVRLYRLALAAQLLTPAYNMATLAWKKRNVLDRGLKYDITVSQLEFIQQSIAADAAWLKAKKRRSRRRTP
jgi:hypothetical protein